MSLSHKYAALASLSVLTIAVVIAGIFFPPVLAALSIIFPLAIKMAHEIHTEKTQQKEHKAKAHDHASPDVQCAIIAPTPKVHPIHSLHFSYRHEHTPTSDIETIDYVIDEIKRPSNDLSIQAPQSVLAGQRQIK